MLVLPTDTASVSVDAHMFVFACHSSFSSSIAPSASCLQTTHTHTHTVEQWTAPLSPFISNSVPFSFILKRHSYSIAKCLYFVCELCFTIHSARFEKVCVEAPTVEPLVQTDWAEAWMWLHCSCCGSTCVKCAHTPVNMHQVVQTRYMNEPSRANRSRLYVAATLSFKKRSWAALVHRHLPPLPASLSMLLWFAITEHSRLL